MDVLRNNYKEGISSLLKYIPKAAAIGIDLEMSGIRTDEGRSENDTPMEHYHKTISAANKYRIVQLGMSVFIPLEPCPGAIHRYESHVFNFYLFPHAHNGRCGQDVRLETSAIDFLNKNGTVDFNKWIGQGIPYANSQNRCRLEKVIYNDWLSQAIESARIEAETENPITDKTVLTELNRKVAHFTEWFTGGGNPNEEFEVRDIKRHIQKHLLSRLYREYPQLFETVLISDVKAENGNMYLTFARSNIDAIRSCAAERRAKFDKVFDEALGFSYFWPAIKQAISANNVPVVLHNSFLDLLFMYSHLEADLGKNMLEFKKHVHEHMFPFIFDTKVVARGLQLDNLSLSELSAALTVPDTLANKVEFEDKSQSTDNAFTFHNAGYDALTTGQAFLKMKHNLESVSEYENLVKFYGNSNFLCDMANPEMDYIISKSVYAIFPKAVPVVAPQINDKSGKNAVDKDTKGDIVGKIVGEDAVVKEPHEIIKEKSHSQILSEIVESFNSQNAVGAFKVSRHKPSAVLKIGEMFVLRTEITLSEDLHAAISKDYEIRDMHTHYKRMLEAFTTKVYKTPEKA